MIKLPSQRQQLALGSGYRAPILFALIAGYAIGAISSPFLRFSGPAVQTQQLCAQDDGLSQPSAALGAVEATKVDEAASLIKPSSPKSSLKKPAAAPAKNVAAAADEMGSGDQSSAAEGEDGDETGATGGLRVKAGLSKRARMKCSQMDKLRTQYVDFLTKDRSTIYWANTTKPFEGVPMNHIGQLDAEVLLPLISNFAPHDVFMIDIGANVGQTSTAFMDYICKGPCTSQSACRGKPNVGVIAFEPQRATFEAINDLAARNKWHLCGWTAQNKAVSNAPGTMQLYGGNTHASLNQDAAWLDRQGFGENKTETVVVTTVDEVVEAAGIKHIFLLKIDTEGFDPFVVRGATKTLTNKVAKYVLAEYNTKWYQADPRSSLERFVGFMWRYGYLCYVFTPENFVPLTGNWWHPDYEFKRWSNIFCGAFGDIGLELLLARVNKIYAPPLARCTKDSIVDKQDAAPRARSLSRKAA